MARAISGLVSRLFSWLVSRFVSRLVSRFASGQVSRLGSRMRSLPRCSRTTTTAAVVGSRLSPLLRRRRIGTQIRAHRCGWHLVRRITALIARSTNLVGRRTAWVNHIQRNFSETSSAIVTKGLAEGVLNLLMSLNASRRVGLASSSSRGLWAQAIVGASSSSLVVAPNQIVVHAIVEILESFVLTEIWEIGKALFKSMLRSRCNVDPIVGVMRPIPVFCFEGCVSVASGIAITSTCAFLSVALVALSKFIPLAVLATM